MELPLNYIILTILKMLASRNKKLEININSLIKSIKEILRLLPISNEELRNLIFSFNLSTELDNFINEYSYIVELEENNLTFNEDLTIEDIDTLLEEEEEKNDVYAAENIENIINNNVNFLNIFKIEVNKELYKFLLKNEKNLEELYLLLNKSNNKEEIITRIKRVQFKNRIMFINMQNLMDVNEYYDLLLYSEENKQLSEEKIKIPFLLPNEYDSEYLLSSTCKRALFLVEPNYISNLCEKLDKNIKKNCNLFDDLEKSELKFYLVYLNLLEEEIKNTTNEEIKEELLLSKYRLMNSLDSIYDTITFIKKENYEEEINENYNFIESEIYYFIREILEYTDEMYNKDEIITTYYNIIKKIFVKTYYTLTKDKNIISEIKNNKLYKVNKISSNLLEDIVIKDNIKKKKKQRSEN